MSLLKHFGPTLQMVGRPLLPQSKRISFSTNRNILCPCAIDSIINSMTFCSIRYFNIRLRNDTAFKNTQLIQFPQRSLLDIKQLNMMDSPSNSTLDLPGNVRSISHSCQCHHPMSNTVSSNLAIPSQRRTNKTKFKKHPGKPSSKEFTIKEKMADRDLSIMMTKMQNLLKKGKLLEIYVKYKTKEGLEKENAAFVSGVQKKLQDNLEGVKTLRTDYSNNNTTKFTVIPVDKQEKETMPGASNGMDKTS